MYCKTMKKSVSDQQARNNAWASEVEPKTKLASNLDASYDSFRLKHNRVYTFFKANSAQSLRYDHGPGVEYDCDDLISAELGILCHLQQDH